MTPSELYLGHIKNLSYFCATDFDEVKPVLKIVIF